MSKKLETQKLVTSLEITGRKTKKKIWIDLAERLQKPTRNNIVVNLDKINKMALKNKDKTFIIPGKVLSNGILEEKATIVAVNASQKTIEKILGKGKFIFLKDFVDEKVDTKNLILVK